MQYKDLEREKEQLGKYVYRHICAYIYTNIQITSNIQLKHQT